MNRTTGGPLRYDLLINKARETSVNRIGGDLDYAKLAQHHRPADPAALTGEIRRQAAQGLKPRDIASAIGAHIAIVLRELRQVNPRALPIESCAPCCASSLMASSPARSQRRPCGDFGRS